MSASLAPAFDPSILSSELLDLQRIPISGQLLKLCKHHGTAYRFEDYRRLIKSKEYWEEQERFCSMVLSYYLDLNANNDGVSDELPSVEAVAKIIDKNGIVTMSSPQSDTNAVRTGGEPPSRP